jgi:hypothetical protein
LTTSGAADTVAANCVAQGFNRGVTQNPDFDRRGLLVNIDNQIIPVRTTECERQSSQNGADGYFDELVMNQRNLLQFQRSAQTKARMKNRA